MDFTVNSTGNSQHPFSASKEKGELQIGGGYITWTAMGLMVAPLTGVSLSTGSGTGSTSRGKLTREQRVSRWPNVKEMQHTET